MNMSFTKVKLTPVQIENISNISSEILNEYLINDAQIKKVIKKRWLLPDKIIEEETYPALEYCHRYTWFGVEHKEIKSAAKSILEIKDLIDVSTSDYIYLTDKHAGHLKSMIGLLD